MRTIKSSSEITEIFERGQRVGTPELSLIVLRNERQHDHNGRVAFIAGKKLGGAVWRNRAKRRMRAVCHELGGPFSDFDVVFLARKRVTEASYDDMKRHVRGALRKAGLKYD